MTRKKKPTEEPKVEELTHDELDGVQGAGKRTYAPGRFALVTDGEALGSKSSPSDAGTLKET